MSVEITEGLLDVMDDYDENKYTPSSVSHVYHHTDEVKPATFNFKVEKNSRGFNWELTINGARTLDEARTCRDLALQAVNELIAADAEKG